LLTASDTIFDAKGSKNDNMIKVTNI